VRLGSPVADAKQPERQLEEPRGEDRLVVGADRALSTLTSNDPTNFGVNSQ
jgi:hypothetical protein